jgi:mono/diheme cytochrome c family protein
VTAARMLNRNLTKRLFPESRVVRAAWIAAMVMSIGLLFLPWIVRLNGKPHADWQQFLGRFHPLAVHLPIGLILLLPLLEIGERVRPALREAAGFVLGLAFVACLAALTLGYLLAYGSGAAGETVTLHMWGGIALTIGVFICMLSRTLSLSGIVPWAYPFAQACLLLILIWTAHEGGTLTHGKNYLTEYMPVPLKRWSALETKDAAAPAGDSFYTRHLHPIFNSNCVVCHGAEKVQGGLRLDSYALLMKGGEGGIVVVPGKPESSLLITRVTLPVTDKHFMPAEGHPPLRSEEIAWLREWIQQGASPSTPTLAGISIPAEAKELPPQPVGDYSALMAEISKLNESQGAKLISVSSKPSDGLILNTVDAASSFGDAQLAQFERFAPFVVEAELGRTAVTDASFDSLSKFSHLRALHLEGTAITGAGLAKLAPLSQLIYLNLSGTKVTSAVLAPLASMKNLRHIYLFNTPAEPMASDYGSSSKQGVDNDENKESR